MKNFILPALMTAGALALGTATPAAAQASSPFDVSAELRGRGATGTFQGHIEGDQLCYTLTTSGMPGATNPRLQGSGGRTVQLLPIEDNRSEGCVRLGNQNARLIEGNRANWFVYVGGVHGDRSLEGQLR